jgi:hypothetical protein
MVPNSARFAGTYGNGLIKLGGRSPDIYRKILKNFAAEATDAKKDRKCIAPRDS